MRSVNNHRAFAGNYSESAVTEALFAPIVGLLALGTLRQRKQRRPRQGIKTAARCPRDGGPCACIVLGHAPCVTARAEA